MTTGKLFTFPSNDLRYLKDGPTVPGLTPSPPVISPVFGLIDTNVMLGVISCKAQYTKPTARTNLEEAVDAGILRLFATTQAKEEVLRHLPTYPSKASPERMGSAKHSILGKIYFVEPRRRMSNNIRELSKRDPGDVPHAELFEELKLDVILSRDNDWEATDYPCLGLDDDDLLLFLRDYARAAAESRGLHGTIAAGTILTMAAGQGLYGLFKQLPGWAKFLTAGGAFLALCGVVAQAKSASPPQKQVADLPPTDFFSRMHESGARSVALASRINKLLERRDTLTLNQHLLRILALADEPLEVSEIEQQLLRTGYKSVAKNFSGQVLRALRANRIFAMSDSARWQMRTPINIEETKLPEQIRTFRASLKRQAK